MQSGRTLRRLLRLVLGQAMAAAGSRWSGYGRYGQAQDRSGEDLRSHAALAVARCRLALAEARTERERRVADLLRYGAAREVLVAREAAEPSGPGKDALQRSLATLDERLTDWFEQLDALHARIAALESDLAHFRTLAGEEPDGGTRKNGKRQESGKQESGAGEKPADPPRDAELARYLAALGLVTMPATMVELKAAYRSRLKTVHPDVGAQADVQASTEATAAATVAFAELRKRFVRP